MGNEKRSFRPQNKNIGHRVRRVQSFWPVAQAADEEDDVEEEEESHEPAKDERTEHLGLTLNYLQLVLEQRQQQSGRQADADDKSENGPNGQ